MDSFSLRSKPQSHARSISLPSRSHQLSPQVDEHLCKLNETTSASLSSIRKKLSILEEIYECLNDFLLLPNTQEALSKNEKWVEEALDGYLMLLDLCSAAKDISSHIKQDLQGLSSFLRRRGNANELRWYLIARKNAKKVIQKSLKSLKYKKCDHNEKGCSFFKEVEEATIQAFESLYWYTAGRKSQSRLTGLVRKMIHGKNVPSSNEEKQTNELEKIYIGLKTIINPKTGKIDNAMNVEHLQGQLRKMELQIQDLEDGLDCLFRHLIKSRVSLLNGITH